jgi:hypothetical protein
MAVLRRGMSCQRRSMSENSQTRHRYRLVNDADEVMEEKDLPTDGEAVVWSEDVRGRTPGLSVRRVERLDENNQWVFVSEAGTLSADDEEL